jgi:DNA replicative helicase MCM subunit Mcm2 (Cdc46/Mcm family)
MEETHQDVIFKLREDAKQDEGRKIARAVAEVKTEEQEKRHDMMQEMRVKEQDRIREAVETERRILESQHGSVTQLQQV